MPAPSPPKIYNASIRAVAMPKRITQLPVSDSGFPVPAFVTWIEGKPDFRVIDTPFMERAWKKKLCWVCGQPMGRVVASVLGPMCTVNRAIAEPPSHAECAFYAAKACPFLANPRMRRNTADLPENRVEPPGLHIERNPGVVAVWITRYVHLLQLSNGVMFSVGDPEAVHWFHRGAPATRDDVTTAIASGLPALVDAELQDRQPNLRERLAQLEGDVTVARRYLPAPETNAPWTLHV